MVELQLSFEYRNVSRRRITCQVGERWRNLYPYSVSHRTGDSLLGQEELNFPQNLRSLGAGQCLVFPRQLASQIQHAWYQDSLIIPYYVLSRIPRPWHTSLYDDDPGLLHFLQQSPFIYFIFWERENTLTSVFIRLYLICFKFRTPYNSIVISRNIVKNNFVWSCWYWFYGFFSYFRKI